MAVKKESKSYLWVALGGAIILILAVVYFALVKNAGATYTPEIDECVEVQAPDPIKFEKKIGLIKFSFQWFESPEGTWKLYKDIDPRGGYEYWIYANETIVENKCPAPEEPEAPSTPNWSPSPDGQRSTTDAPGICVDNTIGKVAWANIEQGVPNDNSVKVNWALPANASEVHIMYREAGRGWEHALRNAPNNGSVDIYSLKNGVEYFFTIAGVKACENGKAVGPWSSEYSQRP